MVLLGQAEGGGSSPSLAPRPWSAPHQGVHIIIISITIIVIPCGHITTITSVRRGACEGNGAERSIPGVEPSLALVGSRALGRPPGAEPKSIPLLPSPRGCPLPLLVQFPFLFQQLSNGFGWMTPH